MLLQTALGLQKRLEHLGLRSIGHTSEHRGRSRLESALLHVVDDPNYFHVREAVHSHRKVPADRTVAEILVGK